MNINPSSTYRVRFKDCDPLGHLYNTRFLDYLLEAREDHIIENYQLDLHQYAKTRAMAWVIVHHEIAYLQEAVRNEMILIKSALIACTDKRIKNEYQMWDADQKNLKSLMWTQFLHVDLRVKKTCNHPEDIQDKLSSILMSIESQSFSDRILYLKKQVSLD